MNYNYKINKKDNKVIIPGFYFLRILMSFEVVLCHYWQYNGGSYILAFLSKLRNYAVPSFICLSFFLTASGFYNGERTFLKNRLERIIRPHLFWSIVLFAFYKAIGNKWGGTSPSFVSFIKQIITGSDYNAPMWYQVVLCVCTICIYFIFNKKDCIKSGLILLLVLLFVQYSNINTGFFQDLPFCIKYCYGRVCEIMPCAICGIFLSNFNKVNISHRALYSSLILVTIIFFLKYPVFNYIGGFNYSGIDKPLIASAIVLFFCICPLDMLPERIIYFFKVISSYTFGVYCIHIFIGQFIKHILYEVCNKPHTDDISLCLAIWMFCVFLCFIVDKVTKGRISFAVH